MSGQFLTARAHPLRRAGADGVVCVDAVVVVLESITPLASGCTDRAAANYAPHATSDDGSCEWVGGRGMLLQSWGTGPAHATKVRHCAENANSSDYTYYVQNVKYARARSKRVHARAH